MGLIHLTPPRNNMVQYQLKLKLTKTQQKTLDSWLWNLTGVWNWAIRKIELDARDHIYHSSFDLSNLLVGHSVKVGIPSHVLQGVLAQAHLAWKRCFKKLAKRPHLKGIRNKLNSIPFPDPIKPAKNQRFTLPSLGPVKFHKQWIPDGRIKCSRLIKKSSGWHLCLFIDAEPKSILHIANGEVGIDPGFKHLLTLSTGEKIEHPRELEAKAKRLAQAQRGKTKKLVSRIHEKISNQRKDRNHKLSRRLIAENNLIVFSKDNHQAIAKKFGKSVSSSSHGQLQRMLSYKSSFCGRVYLEVNPKNSTKTCSTCSSLTGPTGWDGLAVRQWVCEVCGTSHDRDCNAAMNTLIVGLGDNHERVAVESRLKLSVPLALGGELNG